MNKGEATKQTQTNKTTIQNITKHRSNKITTHIKHKTNEQSHHETTAEHK